jgi:L-lactate dehydrogenase complex protein LldF
LRGINRHPVDEQTAALPFASSLCGACFEACPVRIDIPQMLIELRRDLDERRIAPWSERVVFKTFAGLLARPALYRLAARGARLLQAPFARDGAVRGVPFFFADWIRTRDLPAVARRTFQERWPELEREARR